MRRLIAGWVWLLATVAATVMVWSAVSVVAADVTDRPAPVVAHRDVVSALHSAATAPPTSTAPNEHGANGSIVPSGTTVVHPPSTKAAAPAGGSVRPFTPFTAPPTTAAPRLSVTPTTKVVPHPTPTTTTTAVPSPQDPSATYSTPGGVATVACHGNEIRLVSAAANDGFTTTVVTGGPQFVVVHFDGTDQNSAVNAACLFGRPFAGPAGSPGPTPGP